MMIDAIDETSLMLSNFPAQETHKRFIVIWSKTKISLHCDQNLLLMCTKRFLRPLV
jgi:hypothetical protein